VLVDSFGIICLLEESFVSRGRMRTPLGSWMHKSSKLKVPPWLLKVSRRNHSWGRAALHYPLSADSNPKTSRLKSSKNKARKHITMAWLLLIHCSKKLNCFKSQSASESNRTQSTLWGSLSWRPSTLSRSAARATSGFSPLLIGSHESSRLWKFLSFVTLKSYFANPAS